VVDADHEPGLAGELLQFKLLEAHPRTIRAAVRTVNSRASG
jgi:hypothetical protein